MVRTYDREINCLDTVRKTETSFGFIVYITLIIIVAAIVTSTLLYSRRQKMITM